MIVIWDSLFILLVLAPVVTGGVWLNRPGLHLEYTEPGFAAVALALALWHLRKQGCDPFQKSLICASGRKAWGAWTRGLENAPALFLSTAWLTVTGLWFLTSYLRHRAFGSGLADLGIFTNAIANVSSFGFPFSSLKEGHSLLSDHQIFLLFPLGWIFPLWPSPLFLLLLQALFFSSGAIALFLLGRQRLGLSHPVVPWLPFLFWLSGPLRAAARFDFHPEIFMLPAFLFAAFFLQERSWKRRGVGLLFLAVALAAKESAGPVACGMGIAWLLGAGPDSTRAFTRKLGGTVAILGVVAFYFDSHIVPALFGLNYAYSDLYAPLSSSPLTLILSPFLSPVLFFGRLLTWSRAKFLFATLLPLGFLPLLEPFAAIAALPGFLMLFLTSGEHRISLGYHYAVEPMIGLLFALPSALSGRLALRHKAFLLPALALAGVLSFGRSDTYFWRVYEPTLHQSWLREEILPLVPTQVSISASYGMVPHLSVRRWVNQIPYFTDEKQAPVDCALIDSSLNNTPLNSLQLTAAREQLLAQKYSETYHCGTFSLFRRENGPACMTANPPCPEGT